MNFKMFTAHQIQSVQTKLRETRHTTRMECSKGI